MTLSLAILEDNPRRVKAMRPMLARLLPGYAPTFVPTAPRMIAHLEERLAWTALISLDHDLDSVVPRRLQPFDPGCGREVADWLAGREPVCPVIIHTSNGDAAPGMRRVLKEAGWPTARVVPWNDLGWVEDDWGDQIRLFLRAGWIFE